MSLPCSSLAYKYTALIGYGYHEMRSTPCLVGTALGRGSSAAFKLPPIWVLTADMARESRVVLYYRADGSSKTDVVFPF